MNNNKIKEQEISDNVDKIQHAAERIQSLSKALYAVSYTLLVLESQKKTWFSARSRITLTSNCRHYFYYPGGHARNDR